MQSLPQFNGVSMSGTVAESIEPGKSKNKRLTASGVPKKKPKVTTAAVPVPSQPPPPAVPTAGASTRSKGSLAGNNCRKNVKALFLGPPHAACTDVPCLFNHQTTTKTFTKAEMLAWLSKACSGDPDFAILQTSINAKAR